MRLSKRIYELKNQVSIGETVADIGTDHGYVPMLLMRENISPYVIMSDISENSLSKSIETFTLSNIVVSENQFRVGDGLDTINPYEVDVIIIAGLGGHTIVDILSADLEKTRSYKKLVLQPRKHSGTLRLWLYRNNFKITSEVLTSEGKFVCEIITAIPGPHVTDIPYPEDDIRWSYPIEFKKANHELLLKRVNWKLGSIKEQIESLSNSNGQEKTIEKLRQDYAYLLSLIDDEET